MCEQPNQYLSQYSCPYIFFFFLLTVILCTWCKNFQQVHIVQFISHRTGRAHGTVRLASKLDNKDH